MVTTKYNVISSSKSYFNMIDISIDTFPSKILQINISAIDISTNKTTDKIAFYPNYFSSNGYNSTIIVSKSLFAESWKVSVKSVGLWSGVYRLNLKLLGLSAKGNVKLLLFNLIYTYYHHY